MLCRLHSSDACACDLQDNYESLVYQGYRDSKWRYRVRLCPNMPENVIGMCPQCDYVDPIFFVGNFRSNVHGTVHSLDE